MLNFPVIVNDISVAFRAHRFNPQNVHPPIVVRFCRKLVRDEVYRRRIMLEVYNKSKPADERILMHEDLTWRNRNINKAARKAMNLGLLADTWIYDGYVYIKCKYGCIHLAEGLL